MTFLERRMKAVKKEEINDSFFSHGLLWMILWSTQSQTNGRGMVAQMDVAREGEDFGGDVEGLSVCVDGGVDWFIRDDISSCKRLPVDSWKRD